MFLIFGTFVFVDITYAFFEIIQTNHYPAVEWETSVSNVCLAYSTCSFMREGCVICLMCPKHIN